MYIVIIKNIISKSGKYECEIKEIDKYTLDRGYIANEMKDILLYVKEQINLLNVKAYSITYIGFKRWELDMANRSFEKIGISQIKSLGEELWHFENGKTIKKHIDYKE